MIKLDGLLVFEKALALAAIKHSGQVRKYTGDPYILHPIAVSQLVRSVDLGNSLMNEAARAAAVLHDTLEDTSLNEGDLRAEMGDIIAELVLEVTDVSQPSDGNRVKRKALDRDHLAKSSPAGATIKLADLIDNTSSIVRHDPHFAKVYLQEKEEFLDVLGHGHPDLLAPAKSVLRNAKRELMLRGY